MSRDNFTKKLLLGLLSLTQRRAPVELCRLLARFGFKSGDVSFRHTRKGKYWAQINRWPWELRRACRSCDTTLANDALELGYELCSSCAAIGRSNNEL